MVAVPLVLFALGGRVLDRYLGTSPWLLLLGILISIVTSSVVIMRKALAVISESEHDDDEETSEATNRND
jgi:F0F1-type ATP synthase assembly protein I